MFNRAPFFPLLFPILAAVLAFSVLPPVVASAQSVEAVVGDMQDLYNKQLQTVETFVVETNHYTSYYERVVRDGTPTYRSATRLSMDGSSSFANEAPSTVYGFDFDQLRKHARYGGTETIDGTRSHVLIINNPAAFDPEMEMPTENGATRLTYYISAERHLPVRMVMESKENEAPESKVVVDLKNYQTTDGLTLPHRMETQVNIDLSEEERRQMEQMMQQLKNLPERQRKQMEKMMGEQMDMMRGVMSGEPVVIEVRSVEVNVTIPEGVFASASAN